MEHIFHNLVIIETEEYGDVYCKTDADLVIAERDKVIEEQENLIATLKKERDWLAKDRAQAYDDLEKRAQLNIKQEKSIRHQKHKRCLAMARWCEANLEKLDYKPAKDYTDKDVWRIATSYYTIWHKRWLQLAEQVKTQTEAK